MKAMLTGFAAVAIIGVIAHFSLQNIGFSAQEQNSSSAVRLK